MSRVIGSKEHVAVEYALKENIPADQRWWLYGTMCLWVGGHRIGNHEDVTALTVVHGALPGLLRHSGTRVSHSLQALPAATAFDEIYQAVYEASDDLTVAELHALAEKYDRFHALPMTEAFDRWMAFVVEGAARDRFLVRRPDGSLLDVWTPGGSHHRVMQQLLAQLDAHAIANPQL